ncbi:MAG: septum formation initiator family protein [Deferribacteres bacterium]|nr:septum formation initiator family protein [candidate division KSB1 bacterium]MCB9502501.1 septum formation initiator family protein [Deferribacteres bacterium]
MAESEKNKSTISKLPVQRRHAWIIISGVLLFLLYIYIAGDFGLLRHWQLSNEKQLLEKEIEELQFKRDSLQVAIERLKTDSSYMAKIAREKYNMGLPDEEIIKIINKDSDALNEKQ